MIKALWYVLIIIYTLGTAFYIAGNRMGKENLQRLASIIAFVGLLANSGLLFMRLLLVGRLPLANSTDFVLWFSFLTVLMYLLYEFKSNDRKAGGIIMAMAAILIFSITPMANQLSEVKPLMPALKSQWLTVHVLTAALAYAAFALAAGFALRNILKRDFTRYDRSIYHIVAGGFAMLSLSIVLGAIWAEATWGAYWSWDPKETWALITWIIYALYLHLHQKQNWQGKRSNIMILTGFILVLFTFFGVNFLMSGLHSYA